MEAREPDHLPERPYCTNPLLLITARALNGAVARCEENSGTKIVRFTFLFLPLPLRRIRHIHSRLLVVNITSHFTQAYVHCVYTFEYVNIESYNTAAPRQDSFLRS